MSLTMAIVMMIGAWILVAAAMLWGVMRIARRHQHPAPTKPALPLGSSEAAIRREAASLAPRNG
ncbi:hypothetical protein RAM80_07955 [Pseudomonas sp. App30]|uniref:hypothetical protein n=1 Tax=Pseudomonas sp. App30 TaxID=3068990 RepID=UPI003A7FD9FC